MRSAEFTETVPAELADICRKALSKNPRERYADALSFQKAVQEFLKHRQSTVIAERAERESRVQEIPNLARAVILYAQALELWPQNNAARMDRDTVGFQLRAKELSVGRLRNSFRAAAAAIVIGLTVGFFGIKNEQENTEIARKNAETQKGFAVQLAKDEAEARKDADIQRGIAVQKAKDEAKHGKMRTYKRALPFKRQRTRLKHAETRTFNEVLLFKRPKMRPKRAKTPTLKKVSR